MGHLNKYENKLNLERKRFLAKLLYSPHSSKWLKKDEYNFVHSIFTSKFYSNEDKELLNKIIEKNYYHIPNKKKYTHIFITSGSLVGMVFEVKSENDLDYFTDGVTIKKYLAEPIY